MKKTCAIFLFLIAPLGASGTVIHMSHPVLGTTVKVSWLWNNEIWIKLKKVDREFHEKSDAFDATYAAWLDGSDVVIKLAWQHERERDGDVKGKDVYNRLCAFLGECGVPYQSSIYWEEWNGLTSGAVCGHFYWKIPQEDVRDVTID